MPIVERSDVVEELGRLRDQLRRGIVAPSRDDADYIIEPAIQEIRRLRRQNGRLRAETAELRPAGQPGD